MSIYENYSFPLKKKGIRQTYFQGFNHPETFETIDYDVYKPLANDHRRTLLWEPHVVTDAEGHATATLWNNGECRRLMLSAEGITEDGKPMLYQPTPR